MSFRSSKAQWLADRLVQWRWLLLGLATLLGITGFFVGRNLDFDHSIESMFATDNPVLKPYRQLKEKFGGNEIVLAVYEDRDLFNPDGSGIRRLELVAEQLQADVGVHGVLSLSQVNTALEMLYSPQKMLQVLTQKANGWRLEQNRIGREPTAGQGSATTELPGIQGDNDHDAAPDKPMPIVDPKDDLAKEFLKIFEGYTHSPDRQIVSIACILESNDDVHISRRQTIERLRSIIRKYPEGQLAGEPVMVVDGFQYVQRDGKRLGFNSAILVSIVILLCFRSGRWILIPLAVMQLTLVMTRAALVLLGLQLTMVSSMLTAIVVVISVATVVHIIIRYREARLEGKSPEDSMRRAFQLLIFPIIWACLTDAAGFGSLMVAKVGPVSDFGLMMMIASILVLVGIMLVVPGLAFTGENRCRSQKGMGREQASPGTLVDDEHHRATTRFLGGIDFGFERSDCQWSFFTGG